MANPIPEGLSTVTPYLLVKDAGNMIEFLEKAFGAELPKPAFENPKGTVVHAQVKIGDSIVMVGEAPEDHGPTHSMLYLYVKDVDSFFKKAVEGGAVSLHDVEDMFYGDRAGAVKDPAGNVWWVATHKEDLSPAELAKRAPAAKAPKKAADRRVEPPHPIDPKKGLEIKNEAKPGKEGKKR